MPVFGIQPPTRHLTPPEPSALRTNQLQHRQLAVGNDDDHYQVDDDRKRQPSQFSLGMNKGKQRMRFSRRSRRQSNSIQLKPLPHSIQEAFPAAVDDLLVLAAKISRRKRKRSINGIDDHHHHHHHDHPEDHDPLPVDKGCTILGVYYELGQVVGQCLHLIQLLPVQRLFFFSVHSR